MSQSHTGRNGTLFESGQTTTQRTKFNATMDVTGQNTDGLKLLFSKSPLYVGTGSTGVTNLNVSTTGSADGDRGAYLNASGSGVSNPYTSYREAFASNIMNGTVTGGFGFGEAVSLDYANGPRFKDEGYAVPEIATGTLDLGDSAASANDADTTPNVGRDVAVGERLIGHPNLVLSGSFVTSTVSGDSSANPSTLNTTQVTSNSGSIPGSAVSNTSARRTAIGDYFRGAGDRRT